MLLSSSQLESQGQSVNVHNSIEDPLCVCVSENTSHRKF